MSHKLVSLYIGDGEYYTRTDADKVIAEKDKEIAELLAEVEDVINTYKASVENKVKIWERCKKAEADTAEKDREISHQKYKRCLAMARMCEERYNYLTCLENWQMTDKEYQQAIGDYWDRWHNRWLELAEKFKPNDKE